MLAIKTAVFARAMAAHKAQRGATVVVLLTCLYSTGVHLAPRAQRKEGGVVMLRADEVEVAERLVQQRARRLVWGRSFGLGAGFFCGAF